MDWKPTCQRRLHSVSPVNIQEVISLGMFKGAAEKKKKKRAIYCKGQKVKNKTKKWSWNMNVLAQYFTTIQVDFIKIIIKWWPKL